MIISYWVSTSPRFLRRLLAQISRTLQGKAIPVIIVCNGGDIQPFRLPPRSTPDNSLLVMRENSGFNLGAWEFGWRSVEARNYLFLQDDCFIKDRAWHLAFVSKFEAEPELGLLGERINPNWTKTWEELKRSGLNEVVHRYDYEKQFPLVPNVDNYLDFMRSLNIPCGDRGTHLQSLVLFTSRHILLEVGGFPLPDNASKGRAVAAEIAISKRIEAKRYKIDTVGPRPFTYVGHREWIDADAEGNNLLSAIATRFRRAAFLGRKPEKQSNYRALSEAKKLPN